MFRHTVMFRWGDDVDDADVEHVTAVLDTLPGLIAEIVEYRHGRDARMAENNFDYVVVADFASAADYLVYRDHPEHQRVIAEHLAGRIAEPAAVQYEVPDALPA